jgi:hypothetical protein
MATMYVVFDETNRAWKPPPQVMKNVHYVTMRLDSMELSDEEVANYAQALGMMLLSAVRDAHVADEKSKSSIIRIKQ